MLPGDSFPLDFILQVSYAFHLAMTSKGLSHPQSLFQAITSSAFKDREDGSHSVNIIFLIFCCLYEPAGKFIPDIAQAIPSNAGRPASMLLLAARVHIIHVADTSGNPIKQ